VEQSAKNIYAEHIVLVPRASRVHNGVYVDRNDLVWWRQMAEVTAWCNQAKNAIRAKKSVNKAYFQNKAEHHLHSQYVEVRKYAAQVVKKSRMQSWHVFGHTVDIF